jgi:predicted O-linked N-acetylglucosamine transferase (SPINDLY family)
MPAIHRLEEAIALDTAKTLYHLHLAQVYSEIGQSEKALASARQAAARGKEGTRALGPIASALMSQGKMREAISLWQELLATDPNPEAHSAYLFSLHYPLESDPASIAAEHFRFASLYEAPLRAGHQPHTNPRDPNRTLRVGYVSPDYKNHPVRQFLLPLLKRHDPAAVEFYCYSSVNRPDEGTMEFQRLAGPRWRDILQLDNTAVASLIRADAIDILVDLAGHTGGNQLMIFAHKPAPVQVTWLGYPDTTGFTSIDYRFTDAIADPPGMTEAFHSEQLFRLPCFLTWDPPGYLPPVAPPPCLRNGYVTFGSFNNFMKIDPATIRLWAAILQSVPGSKLLLKHRDARDPVTQEQFASYFEGHNVSRDRIILTPQMPSHAVHLQHYGDMDISLDPFPYNGTTTSCEALAMGVPMITLAGQAHVGRVGAMLNAQYGLTDWTATTKEQYLAIAVEKAADPQALEQLRFEMRDRLAASTLGKPADFVRNVEAAYRTMWHSFCSNQ